MDNITITFNTILQLFGAIAVIGGGIKILVGMFNPFRDLKAEVEKIREKICFCRQIFVIECHKSVSRRQKARRDKRHSQKPP